MLLDIKMHKRCFKITFTAEYLQLLVVTYLINYVPLDDELFDVVMGVAVAFVVVVILSIPIFCKAKNKSCWQPCRSHKCINFMSGVSK